MQTTDVPATFSAGPTPAPAEQPQPLRLSEVRARIQRPRTSVPLYLDAELASEIADAAEALERAVVYDETSNEPDTAPALARHLRDLEDAAEASRVLFVLQAISHRAYQRLVGEHPPTEAQRAMLADVGGEAPPFDADALAPRLVRKQLVSPQVDSDAEFTAFWDDLNDGQLQQLWQSALTVQLGVTDPGPKSETASDILARFGTT
ncbi:hypothetical protein [Streptomyces sp. NBC_01477]|uniref:hypothetical protein n=1 Tax=Streptomyces sp. NBC_01477 TaxID=2976015 RepID=UPI002E2F7EC7|nr:hypothetical protein [Streptomyces sp. NBC_01477]